MAIPGRSRSTRSFRSTPRAGSRSPDGAYSADSHTRRGTFNMAKYLIHGSYSVDGIAGVVKAGGTSRVKAVEALVASVGGTMESFYFSFGKDDFYTIVDAPNNVSAAAVAMTVGATGAATLQTVVLLTADEIDQAAKTTVDYRRPGA